MSARLLESLNLLLEHQDLSRELTEAAFSEIMTGQASAVQVGAWMVAMRMKGETADELAACIDVMRREVHSVHCADKMAVDSVGTGGDGAHTINISTTAAIVAAGAGVTVAKHGNRAVSSKSGSADVLGALGINLEMTPDQMETALNETGFSFLFAPKLHPAMKHAIEPRRELKIRTIFNLLGPMTNPAGVTRAVIGVFNEKYCRLLAEAAAKTGTEHSMFVHGSDGLDEITLTGPTTIITVRHGAIEEELFDPQSLGLNYCRPSDLAGGTPQENADLVKGILDGSVQGPKRDIVALNAAAILMVAEKAECWPEALEKAFQSIDSGAALEKLNTYIGATR